MFISVYIGKLWTVSICRENALVFLSFLISNLSFWGMVICVLKSENDTFDIYDRCARARRIPCSTRYTVYALCVLSTKVHRYSRQQ